MKIRARRNRRRPKNVPKVDFSKKIAVFILITSVIEVFLSYILAFLGRDNIAESLSKLNITQIISVFLIYCVKAFFGKKGEEATKLVKWKWEMDNNANSEEEDIDE